MILKNHSKYDIIICYYIIYDIYDTSLSLISNLNCFMQCIMYYHANYYVINSI